MEEIKYTELGNSYWYETGAYQKQYQHLYDNHVPASGCCTTLNGELIRAISRLVYEHCNNGNCNAKEYTTRYDETICYNCNGSGVEWGYGEEEDEEIEITCSECGGSDYVDEEYDYCESVSWMYEMFLKLIENNVPNISRDTNNLRQFIINSDCSFNANEMALYNKVCDKVIHYVLNNEDKPLIEWYINEMK